MKTKLLIALSSLSSLFASEPVVQNIPPVEDHFTYFSIGVGPLPVLLPVFGLGYRSQWDHHGLDVSASASTIVFATQVKLSALYNYYFKPCLSSQMYVGGGVGPSVVFMQHEDPVYTISPEFVIGKEYRNESNDVRFLQAQISFPTVSSRSDWDLRRHRADVLYFPMVTLSYGFGY
jgi:hypothetical protein